MPISNKLLRSVEFTKDRGPRNVMALVERVTDTREGRSANDMRSTTVMLLKLWNIILIKEHQ